jgi:hypothetical protein
MRRLLLPLLLFCSLSSFADEPDNYVEPIVTADTVKEGIVLMCMQDYIAKQSKSYSKIAQANLYALIHSFDSIIAKIYGKKGLPDNISYEEKIELLARVQCEAYYKMGVLK